MTKKEIFSKNLNAILESLQKSQIEVAKAIGVSQQTFNTWCRGVAIPRMDKIQLLADYFHVPMSTLIEDVTQTSSALSQSAEELAKAADMYSQFVKASPQIQHLVKYFLQLGQMMPDIAVPQFPNIELPKPTVELPHLPKDKDK